jgi:AraC-like DNA-binding protein
MSLNAPCSRGFGATSGCHRWRTCVRSAYQQLLESDATAETVAAVAKRWGFTNPGRFAAAYVTRYGESPAIALRRSTPVIAESRPGSRNEPVDPVGVASLSGLTTTRLG